VVPLAGGFRPVVGANCRLRNGLLELRRGRSAIEKDLPDDMGRAGTPVVENVAPDTGKLRTRRIGLLL